MPIVLEKIISATKKLGIWHITESVDELLSLFSEQDVQLPVIEKRRIEFLCNRLLLNAMVGSSVHADLHYDSYGKPHLSGDVSATLSLSHSHHYVAVIIDTAGSEVGIDIEQIKSRIAGLSAKFMNTRDSTHLDDVESLHLVWGGKEVLYKIYGKKSVDFKTHLSVVFTGDTGTGYIHMPHYKTQLSLSYFIFDGFMVVYSGL